jgi:hypothetical protein
MLLGLGVDVAVHAAGQGHGLAAVAGHVLMLGGMVLSLVGAILLGARGTSFRRGRRES